MIVGRMQVVSVFSPRAFFTCVCCFVCVVQALAPVSNVQPNRACSRHRPSVPDVLADSNDPRARAALVLQTSWRVSALSTVDSRNARRAGRRHT